MHDSTPSAPPKASKAVKQKFENLLVDSLMIGAQITTGERDDIPSLYIFFPQETSDENVLMAKTRFDEHRQDFVSMLNWHRERITKSHPSAQARTAYLLYLQSPEWVTKRDQCLDRYDRRCAFCYSDRDVQCHHRTYARLYQERENDLIALCKTCHSKFHDKDS